jgi:hypothetical protein
MKAPDDRWFLMAGITIMLVPFVYMLLVTYKVV